MAARETAGGVSSEPKSPKKSKASATVQSLTTITVATRATTRRRLKRSIGFAKRLPVNTYAFSRLTQGLPQMILKHTASRVKTLRLTGFPIGDARAGHTCRNGNVRAGAKGPATRRKPKRM